MRNEALGVDIDNVLVRDSAPVDGAFEALNQLVNRRFANQVYLVSKCALEQERKTIQWLVDQGFFDRTGVKRAHVYFCRERSDKAGICKKLGITHFIDDRLEVLSALLSVAHLYLFQPDSEEMRQWTQSLTKQLTLVYSWQDVLDNLLQAESP